MDNTAIKAKNISKYFQSGDEVVKAADDISLEVKKKEILLIMGPSGSGKTTLISLIGGLLTPTKGTIFISGKNIVKMGEDERCLFRLDNIGFIFQSFNLLSSLTTVENVEIVLQLQNRLNSKTHKYTIELLKELGLEKRLHFMPGKLSGGEKQRVAIVRALVNKPKIILADEPTANLDSKNGEKICRFLKNLVKEKEATAIVVSHDKRITDIADRVLWLEDGKIKAS